MYQTALKAYETVNKSTMSGREVEAAVLTKAAARMRESLQNWTAPGNAAKLDSALKYNQRIWCILQAELAKPENPLPAVLKNDLLRLSTFVDKRTFEVMAYPSPEKMNILIQINENIAAGLRSRQEPVHPTDYRIPQAAVSL